MDKEHKDRLLQKALQGAAVGTIEKFGSAVKEHLVSFSGKDRELGTETTRSLKSVSKSKVNPEYKETNIKQQAGFSAEIKSVARKRIGFVYMITQFCQNSIALQISALQIVFMFFTTT